jgi:hypothetical protein
MSLAIYVIHAYDYQTGCNLLKSLVSTLIMMVIKLNKYIPLLVNQLDNGDYQGQLPVIIGKYSQFDIPLFVYRRKGEI